MSTLEQKHWKLSRFEQGNDVYDDDDSGEGGDYGSLGGITELSREERDALAQHQTRHENHSKFTKGLILERQHQIQNGQQIQNADMQSHGADKMPHPLLAEKAQFSGMEDNNPFADNDNNQERQLELQLRNTPDITPAPAPSLMQTPTLTRS